MLKEKEKFFKELKKGIVTVEFRKIDTNELRIMPCTLNSDIAEHDINVKSFDLNSHHFVVWAIDKKAYRSFIVETVERWYTGTGVEH